MKKTWIISVTTQRCDPVLNAEKIRIKEFPLPAEIVDFIECCKDSEQKSCGLEKNTIDLVSRVENEI